jgi:hypothetical protein
MNPSSIVAFFSGHEEWTGHNFFGDAAIVLRGEGASPVSRQITQRMISPGSFQALIDLADGANPAFSRGMAPPASQPPKESFLEQPKH